MKRGRMLVALFAVLLLGAACSKGTTSPQASAASGAGYSSQGTDPGMLPVTGGGGQGSSEEEAAEGSTEAGSEGDVAGASGKAVLIAGAGGQMAFSPSAVSVAQGETLVVRNAGTVAHTFTVTGKGIDVTVEPGQSQHVKIDLAPGTYAFVCRFHQGSGMTGTLTVT